MKNILKIILHSILIGLLTIATQVGGIIYVLMLVTKKVFDLSRTSSIVSFISLYLLVTFVFLPLIAPIFGRTALPMSGSLRPLSYTTCLLNRHYVTLVLRDQLMRISRDMHSDDNRNITHYLDANFPLWNGFPLFPHLSHNDGRKVDLAFYYKKNNVPCNDAPSAIGYGVYEDPKGNEVDTPLRCRQKGFWQYGFLSSIVPQGKKNDFQADEDRTRRLIKKLVEAPITSKVFIEPHLKSRWRLHQYEKIRFHGCHAVRHDDHIHLEIK